MQCQALGGTCRAPFESTDWLATVRAYYAFKLAISITKRYFTSLFSMRS
jgi:hypothetical protein